jgi:hypothetical protein
MQKQVIIDCFPESVLKYQKGYAVVAIDVIRARGSYEVRSGEVVASPASESGLAFVPSSATDTTQQTCNRC